MNTSSRRREIIAARFRLLTPLLLTLSGLVVAACNNGSGGSAY